MASEARHYLTRDLLQDLDIVEVPGVHHDLVDAGFRRRAELLRDLFRRSGEVS